MKGPQIALVGVTGPCGHKFAIPFADIRGDITCPDCGLVNRFDDPRLAAIEMAFGPALMEAKANLDRDGGIGWGAADVPRPTPRENTRP